MAYRFNPDAGTFFRICTRSRRVAKHYDPASYAKGSDYCEIIEWAGPGALAYALRRFKVACKYGQVFPAKARGRRSKQRRRNLRGGTIELIKRDERTGAEKMIATCKRGG